MDAGITLKEALCLVPGSLSHYGLFFLPLCAILHLFTFCGKFARAASELLISLWLKLVLVIVILLKLHTLPTAIIHPSFVPQAPPSFSVLHAEKREGA